MFLLGAMTKGGTLGGNRSEWFEVEVCFGGGGGGGRKEKLVKMKKM